MNKVILIVLGLIVAVAAAFGVNKYLKHLQDAADLKGGACLKAYYKYAGEGHPDAAAKVELAKVLIDMEDASKHCRKDMYEALYLRRVDGAFMLGDYDKTTALLDKLPGRTDAWKESAKSKVRAHAALERGDKAAALAAFVAFCAAVEKDDKFQSECDPYTGIEWSKEAVLARNYNRNADLAKELGQAADATAFRAKAADFAKKAVETAADRDSKAEFEKQFAPLLK